MSMSELIQCVDTPELGSDHRGAMWNPCNSLAATGEGKGRQHSPQLSDTRSEKSFAETVMVGGGWGRVGGREV